MFRRHYLRSPSLMCTAKQILDALHRKMFRYKIVISIFPAVLAGSIEWKPRGQTCVIIEN